MESELACLLQQSKGEHGILIERNRDLAQIARDRTSSLGPKNLQVLRRRRPGQNC